MTLLPPPDMSPGDTRPADGPPGDATAAALLDRHDRAAARRAAWEPLWRECYEHALPQHAAFETGGGPGARRGDRLYDATAADAVDQLAAALLAQLTPPWSRWTGLAPGPALDAELAGKLSPLLLAASEELHAQIDRSNFAVEAHQAFLDVVTGGTGCLLVEEAAPGAPSALRFTAVPLADLVLEEGEEGRLDRLFRRQRLTLDALLSRTTPGRLPDAVKRDGATDPARRFPVVEAVTPEGAGWRWRLLLAGEEPAVLADGRFPDMPFIAFRWLKAPGETYGRSPVMKALPDIKTANKVVELVLKNASIAVTGIWQADNLSFPMVSVPFSNGRVSLISFGFWRHGDFGASRENSRIFVRLLTWCLHGKGTDRAQDHEENGGCGFHGWAGCHPLG